jgi:hypothetical protein
MPTIEQHIKDLETHLISALDTEIYLPLKDEMKNAPISVAMPEDTPSISDKREAFVTKIGDLLKELKIALVQDELEKEAPVRNKYEVIILPLLPTAYNVEIQEDDIPIGYRTYVNVSRSSETVREVIVLRPVGTASLKTCTKCGRKSDIVCIRTSGLCQICEPLIKQPGAK